MKKIPTIFERDWEGDRSRVLDKVNPGCEWVFAGEGIATRKYDGSACLIENGALFKRHAIDEYQERPEGFREVAREHNERTGKTKVIGWLPVGDGPEDKWHREALENFPSPPLTYLEGTYELVGPKVQGNPEGREKHTLVYHALAEQMHGIILTFDGIREVLGVHDIEGIVWHHSDGRMAKIKARDFGIKRAQQPVFT